MDAHAVFEYTAPDAKKYIAVFCPYCLNLHFCDSETTPRLIEIPAQCNEHQTYIIGAVVKPKTLHSALNLHKYETERKREQYYKRKERKEKESSGSE